ncbi:MAG: hypothetical protein E7655_04615 [Ruminococcaceae bacterium]|nr:hypothetical protein [Oscillospiraceae bacterium]
MKKETLYDCLGNMDERYIAEAEGILSSRKAPRIQWLAVAAVLVLAMTAVFALPLLKGQSQPPVLSPETDSSDDPLSGDTELAFSETYVYRVNDLSFASYVGGKVVEKEKVGSKLREVSVTAGWQNREGESLSQETLRAEVYEITDVPSEAAVALKFLDAGEAVTTTHFYTLLNPDADAVWIESIAGYFIPADGGDVREIPEGMITTSVYTGEAVTEEGIVVFTTAGYQSDASPELSPATPSEAPTDAFPVLTSPAFSTSAAFDPSAAIAE